MLQKLKWTICSLISGGLFLCSCQSPNQASKPKSPLMGVTSLKTESLPLQPLRTETLPSAPLIPLQPLKSETLPTEPVISTPSSSESSTPEPLRLSSVFRKAEMQFGQYMRQQYLNTRGTEDPFLNDSGINEALLGSGWDFCKSQASGVSRDTWIAKKSESLGSFEKSIDNYQTIRELATGKRPSRDEATLYVQNSEKRFLDEMRAVTNGAISYLCPSKLSNPKLQ